jgi:hypothetical protein
MVSRCKSCLTVGAMKALEKAYQFQPFGGYLSEFRTIQGHRIPTHVETGNFFGTDAYFPFFVVDVPEISLLQ